MTHHQFDASPNNLFWGFFDAASPAVLKVDSGDTVAMTCMPAASEDDLIAVKNRLREDHADAIAALSEKQGNSGHMMTGPVFVRGAFPGDVLQVDILAVDPIQDWGYTKIAPVPPENSIVLDFLTNFHNC